MLNYECYIKTRHPNLALKIISWRFGAESSNYLASKSVMDLIKESDIVIATGGGYVNDSFSDHASKLLDVILLAQYYNRPTIMLGQGLGPLSNKNLVKKFKCVLNGLKLISLREGEFSPKLLNSLMSSQGKPSVFVSGDDAVEMSYRLRTESLGNKLGLNIRNASYATLPSGTIEKLGDVIQGYIHKKKTSYQLLPISLVPGDESDIRSLISLMRLSSQQDNETEEGLSVEDIIQRVSECRVVITGSYHAALFALSQGIQVIGLTASNYYDYKFMGLLKQFEVGVQILYLDDGIDKLSEYLDVAWSRADGQRSKLLERAKQQVCAGKDAYLQLKTFVK
ncbi:polysaccharide pyruvyl transferase family protein [Methylophaga marina]|uniref:polysaccharide pyruvyl transferase family protein n=1 Tax=Methylophaga marina TaxID=45495 RepID=UPI00257231AC|nr:polysaccharide pyruvyl transferase family protein [Methylophaga marina]